MDYVDEKYEITIEYVSYTWRATAVGVQSKGRFHEQGGNRNRVLKKIHKRIDQYRADERHRLDSIYKELY